MNRSVILSILCLASFAAPSWCAETPATPAAGTQDNQSVNATDLEALKQRIAAQQEQIKKLQQAMDEQQKLLERSLQNLVDQTKPAAAAAAVAPAAPAPSTQDGTSVVATSTAGNTTTVNNTTNVARPVQFIPAVGGNNAGRRAAQDSNAANPCDDASSPTFIHLGNVCIVPIGFMDLTGIWRSENAGSGIGTNFGSVPYDNTLAAHNSEFRFSPQNSRVGFRIDGDWKGAHFIGYNEFDFLGTSGATNLTVTNGAFVPRLRLFWVDVRKGKVEFLGGQSWSLLTPNRVGLSALPGDIFYSQVMDVNYMAGLTWTRQPGVRVLVHPSEKVTFGLSFENPDQYMGGANGSTAITLPSALTALAGSQLDNGGSITATVSGTTVTAAANTVLATPTVMPDIIAKLAIDPSSRFHFEVGGITSRYRIWNPNTGSALGAGQHFSTEGAGLLVGLNAGLTKNLRLISTNFWNDGEGRYIFGQAPDVVVRDNGALSGVRSASTVDGIEATLHKTLLFLYYGGIYIDRNTSIDANGKSVIGYGAGSQNRAIQEVTGGFNQTFWKNPRYGAINLIGQYEYATRDPFAVAVGAPHAAHDSTVYMDVRYTLPGSMPKF